MEHTWKIGNVEIPNRVVVAPMAGITNSAFRVTVKEFGAGLVVCEMISDQGIHFRNKKTLEMLHIEETEHPLSLQIFGGNKDSLVEAAQFVEENTAADIIDINMGCPVNKVNIPVTIKMRIGWDEEHVFAVENALAAQSAGASAIAMHGRTRVQMYEGKADWEVLKEVKKHLTIPFMGNGDVKTPEDAKWMLDYVGADGVMIGRAALGNPWMIHRTQHYLETGELIPEPTPAEKIATAKLHLQRLADLKGEKVACREFRTHAAYYLKGIPRAAKVKVAINQTEKQQEINDLLDQFVEKAEKVLLKQTL